MSDPLRALIEELADAWFEAGKGHEDDPAGRVVWRHSQVLRDTLKAAAAAMNDARTKAVLEGQGLFDSRGGAVAIAERLRNSYRHDARGRTAAMQLDLAALLEEVARLAALLSAGAVQLSANGETACDSGFDARSAGTGGRCSVGTAGPASSAASSTANEAAGAVPEQEPALITYMTTESPARRDAAFLRTYAVRIRDGSALLWEIPSTVAGTLEAIANRIEQREQSSTENEKEKQ